MSTVVELLGQPSIPPAMGGLILMILAYCEFVRTAEVSGDRIIIKLFGLRRYDEVLFSDIVSMRFARSSFDDFLVGEYVGAAAFAPRLIVKLVKPRWFSKTLYLKARNAREILAAFNAYRGLP